MSGNSSSTLVDVRTLGYPRIISGVAGGNASNLAGGLYQIVLVGGYGDNYTSEGDPLHTAYPGGVAAATVRLPKGYNLAYALPAADTSSVTLPGGRIMLATLGGYHIVGEGDFGGPGVGVGGDQNFHGNDVNLGDFDGLGLTKPAVQFPGGAGSGGALVITKIAH
jgi:hypothetical protein